MANKAAELKEKWSAKILSNEVKTEGDLKNSGMKTLVELGLSVLVGGAIGSVIGRPAFLVGLAGTFTGHYTGINWIAPIGVGMMASSLSAGGQKTMSGYDLEGVKDRLLSFKDSLIHRTYLDKVLPKGKSAADERVDEGIIGLGNIAEHNKTLKAIEDQLVRSAIAFQRKRGASTAGIEEEVEGMYETDFSGM